MRDEPFYPLGCLDGAEVGCTPTLDGQDILVEQCEVGQRLARLLGWGQADTVQQGDTLYWRIVHNRHVDDLLVELIDLLISIRYAHPAMVQLELVLTESEGIALGSDAP